MLFLRQAVAKLAAGTRRPQQRPSSLRLLSGATLLPASARTQPHRSAAMAAASSRARSSAPSYRTAYADRSRRGFLSSSPRAQQAVTDAKTTDVGQNDAEQHVQYSKYEYPMRKEAPEISRSTPETARKASPSRTPSKSKIPDYDPFDDSCTLSDQDIAAALQRQKEEQAALQASMSSFPIGDTKPAFVPPNFPSQELAPPETQITTLANGVRVVSEDTYDQMCTVGVVTNAGSRHEKLQGSAHLLETLAFQGTKDYPDASLIPKLLQDWGATHFVNSNREQTLYCIDVLRPNVQKAMHMISQVILEPNLHELEVEQNKMVLAFQAEEPMPELVISEALQTAAYGPEQQLGRRHFATLEGIPNLTADSVRQYWHDNIRYNPEGTVVAGAGIDHAELVELAERYFGAMEQKSSPVTVRSTYRGGFEKIEPIVQPGMEETIPSPSPANAAATEESLMPLPQDYCRVAIAFPIGGWHSQHEMVTACVLQTLLGGGSSFSAGGPGKGMYTRMYREVLNQNKDIESAEAFTAFADEEGLMGVVGSTASPDMVRKLTAILVEQLGKLLSGRISDEELSRAKNMLKCNVLSQLESRLVLFEDMGRQILTYGKREDSTTTCARIDAVTAQDIQMLAVKMLSSEPTVAATGKYLDKVPDNKEVVRWLWG